MTTHASTRIGILIAAGTFLSLALASPIGAQTTKVYGKCSQSHAGREYRVKRLTLEGDSKVTKSVAGHAVLYARERYALQDITTQADIDRATREVYDFLTYKVGNPSLVAAQWVSAGYQHFDSHADEAAAALLGMELLGPAQQVRFPREISDWLKTKVDSLGQADSSNAGICAAMGDTTMVGVACQVLLPFVKEAMKRSIDRIGISSATLRGESYDVKDPQIELMIYVKRHPQPYLAGRFGAKRRISSAVTHTDRLPVRTER